MVDWLDFPRYNHPAEAAQLARIVAVELASEGHLETHLRALGVYASSIRMRGSMSLAGMVLSEALRLANQVGPKLEAELTQRAGYVIQDHAKHAEALACFNAAGSLYSLIADHEGIAKVAVDRGICLYLRGDIKAAEEEVRRGLLWLPKEDKRNRIAAHHALAVMAEDRATASEHLKLAEILSEPANAYAKASLCYTKASMAQKSSRACNREKLLREAKVLAERFNVFDSALITLDLLDLLVEEGRRREVTEEGRTVHALMHPLRLHPYAQESLLELARLNGEMTLQDIAAARQAVRTARKEGSIRAESL
jgi:tetratricopeptide (TPR) repeat protein